GDDGLAAFAKLHLSRSACGEVGRIGGRSGGVDHGTAAQFVKDGGGEGVPGTAHTAADYVHLEIQAVDHGCERDSQRAADNSKDAAALLVPLNGQVVDFLGVELEVGA